MRKPLIVTLLALLLVPACRNRTADHAPPPAATAPRHGGIVVIGVLADIDNWNPYLSETGFGEDLLALLYPSLVTELPDYQEHPPTFAPSLAESWTWSDDHLTLTFQLRRDAVWSDGAPVTSRDVLFTWQAQTSPEVAWTSSYVKDFIEEVEAADPYTVRFRFSRQYPYQMMDANDGLIVPAHTWGEIPYSQWQTTAWEEKTLSAGPFRFSSYSPQQEIVLDANPGYWHEGRPLLDRVVWRIIPSQFSLVTQLRTASVDFVTSVPAAAAAGLADNPQLRLVDFEDRAYTFLAWNNRSPLFADARVRRAMTLAIDRQAILDTVRPGFGRVAVGPVLSTMWAFNRRLEPLPHDPEQARSLLAEAGWKDRDGDGLLDRDGARFEFELVTNSENQELRDVTVLVHDQLERLGITVQPRSTEVAALVALRSRGTFDALAGTWREPTQVDLEEVWHSAPVDEPTANFIGYSDPEVDRLLREASAQAEFEQQKVLLDRIQEIIVEQQPYTFLYELRRTAAINRRISGAVINDATPYYNLDEWYVIEGQQAPQ